MWNSMNSSLMKRSLVMNTPELGTIEPLWAKLEHVYGGTYLQGASEIFTKSPVLRHYDNSSDGAGIKTISKEFIVPVVGR